VAALVLVVGVFTAISLIGSSEAPIVQAGTSEQLSLGQKFLIDLEYEKAVAEFNAVIEIEPKNVDAYIGLADAYIGMGDENKAIEALEKGFVAIKEGYDELSDEDKKIVDEKIEKIEKKIEELKPKPIEIFSNEIPADCKSLVIISSNIENYDGYDDAEEHIKEEVEWFKEDLDIDIEQSFVVENAMFNPKELEKIASLEQLEVLEIAGFKLSKENISVIGEMKQLKHLELYCSSLDDISGLSGLVNLDFLQLGYNNISDISALSGMTKLS